MKLELLFPPDGGSQDGTVSHMGLHEVACNDVKIRTQQSHRDGKSASFIKMEQD